VSELYSITCQVYSLSSHLVDCLFRDLDYGLWPVTLLSKHQAMEIYRLNSGKIIESLSVSLLGCEWSTLKRSVLLLDGWLSGRLSHGT
jgi:hypothetical protein